MEEKKEERGEEEIWRRVKDRMEEVRRKEEREK